MTPCRYFTAREQHARRYRTYRGERRPVMRGRVRLLDRTEAAIDLLYQRAREAQRKGRAA